MVNYVKSLNKNPGSPSCGCMDRNSNGSHRWRSSQNKIATCQGTASVKSAAHGIKLMCSQKPKHLRIQPENPFGSSRTTLPLHPNIKREEPRSYQKIARARQKGYIVLAVSRNLLCMVCRPGCMHACMCVYIYTHICIYIMICLHIYICMHICSQSVSQSVTYLPSQLVS